MEANRYHTGFTEEVAKDNPMLATGHIPRVATRHIPMVAATSSLKGTTAVKHSTVAISLGVDSPLATAVGSPAGLEGTAVAADAQAKAAPAGIWATAGTQAITATQATVAGTLAATTAGTLAAAENIATDTKAIVGPSMASTTTSFKLDTTTTTQASIDKHWFINELGLEWCFDQVSQLIREFRPYFLDDIAESGHRSFHLNFTVNQARGYPIQSFGHRRLKNHFLHHIA